LLSFRNGWLKFEVDGVDKNGMPWDKPQEQQDREQQDYRQFQHLMVQRQIAETGVEQLEVNKRRDRRDQRLFWVAIASLFVSGGSLFVASLALYVASLPK